MTTLRNRLTPLFLFLIGSVAMTYDLAVPSFWQDEAATIAGAVRPIPSLIRMATNIDVVHATYYGLMHFWGTTFGFTAFSMRFPSVLAVGVTTALIYLLARKLGSNYSVSVWASIIYLAIPRTHYASSESRSNALTATLAVALTLALVWAIQSTKPRWLTWSIYAITAAASIWIFMFSALILVPHAIYLLFKKRKDIWYFLAATAIALIAASPIIYWGYQEKNQVSWIKVKPLLTYLGEAIFGVNFMRQVWLAAIVLSAILIALFFYFKNRIQHKMNDAITAPSALWLTIPSALLITASLVVHPYFVDHYLTFTTPATALLASAGINKIKWNWVRFTAGIAIIALGFVSLQATRAVNAKGPAWMPVVTAIENNTKPGDGILLPDWRTRNSAEIQIMMDAYEIAYMPGRIDLTMLTPLAKTRRLLGVHVDEKHAIEPKVLMDKIALVTDTADKVPVYEQIPNWIASNYKIDRVQSFPDANLTIFKLAKK